jgi:hypothetical protein
MLNYAQRQKGRTSIVILESLYQTHWKRTGTVPRRVYNWMIRNRAEIAKFASRPAINWQEEWAKKATILLVRHLMKSGRKDYLNAAHFLNESFGELMATANVVKGRVENQLRIASRTQLQDMGFNSAEIDWIARYQRANSGSPA